MAYVFLSLFLIILSIIYFYLKSLYSYFEKHGIPHEKPHLFVGNLKGIGKVVHFRDVNRRIYEKFRGTAPFAGMFFFMQKVIFVMDLELIKKVLVKDFSSFHDRSVYYNVRDDPLTGFLVTLEGEEWRAMRNKTSPIFSSGKMRYMFSTVSQVGENFSKVCAEICKNGDKILDVKDLCARFTTDVIGCCVFGIDCNSLKDPDVEFRRKGRLIFTKPRHTMLIQAFMMTFPKIARMLRMKLLLDEVSEFFLGVIRATVTYRLENKIKRNDFMDLLLDLYAKDQEAARKAGGINLEMGLTLEQLAAQAFSFFAAGFDTSSSIMSYTLFELAKEPEIQQKLREEILEVLKNNDDKLTYENMNEMEYLEQVLCETLRMYPVLPHILRKTTSDFQIPDTDFTIEKGISIIIPADAIHYDPDLYPDPQRFDPERFTAEAIKQRHSCAYLPFGDGPRNCIGMRFGKMQTKIGLINLLKNFKFSISTRTDVPIKFAKKHFLLQTDGGIYLKVESV